MRRRGRSRNRRQRPDAAAAAPAMRQMSAESYATQNDLIGSITRELLVDPVRIQGENTPYERANIRRWLQQNRTSPNTRQPATLNDLVPAEDIRDRIRRFVAIYPDSMIVREWLQQQPAWYTRIGRRIRDTAAPAIATMSRTAGNIRNSQAAATCAQCCSKTAEAGAGAAIGAAVGACAGCSCAAAIMAEDESGADGGDERVALASAATATGAAIGAVYGAVVGPEECLRLGGEAARGYCRELRRQNEIELDRLGWRGGKKKSRKNKKKKRRKTRRKKKKKKTRRKRKKNRKKRTRRK